MTRVFWFERNDIRDYMRRWILHHPWGTIRLHHILRSDDGRDLHCHPWDFVSFMLIGEYTEVTDLNQRHPSLEPGKAECLQYFRSPARRLAMWWRRKRHEWSLRLGGLSAMGAWASATWNQMITDGCINRKKAEAPHRLVLEKPCWTLVFSGKRRRKWGFHTDEGWVYWKDYFVEV